MSDRTHDSQLNALGMALQGLTPRAPALDRDQLMFRAGQAASPKRGPAWPALAAFISITSVVLAGLLFFQPAAPVREQIIYVTIPAPASASSRRAPAEQPLVAPAESNEVERQAPERTEYRLLRDSVVRMGVDALPQSGPTTPANDAMKPLDRDSLVEMLSHMP